MPPKRGKKATSMAVPQPGDEDRKRVLNVLAQRRYRQRKKEKQEALEKRLASLDGGAQDVQSTSSNSSRVETPSEPSLQASPQDFEQELGQFNPQLDDVPDLYDSLSSHSASSPATDGSPNIFDVNNGAAAAAPVSGCFEPGFINPDQLELFNDADFGDNPVIPFQDPLFPSTTATIEKDMNSLMSNYNNTHAFADDALIATRALDLFRAGLGIASMMSLTNSLFDLQASHILPATSPLLPPNLPSNLRPTAIQQQIPHHPFFDIMPWPSVRDRLILVFSQPTHLRPKVAQNLEGEEKPLTALVQMSHDYEDPVEGCRVYGDNYLDDKSWEIGQAFFRRWWWALDREVVERSNFWRRQRGEGALRITEIT